MQERQDIHQQSDHGPVRPKYNQHIQPAYLDKNSLLLQSSPYARKPFEGDNTQQAVARQEADEVYRYQKFGFQPLKQDVNHVVPTAYDNGWSVQNLQISPESHNGQAQQITRPKTSSVLSKPIKSQNLPLITQLSPTYPKHETQHLRPTMLSSAKTALHYQEKGIPGQQWKKQSDRSVILNHPINPPRESTQRVEKITAQPNVVDTNKQTPDVQSLVDKNQGSMSEDCVRQKSDVTAAEIPQLFAQDKVTVTDSASTSSPEVKEVSSTQAEENIPYESNEGMNEGSIYQASVINMTQVIPENDTMLVQSKDVNPLTPNSLTDERNCYNQYRASTPVAPEILEKVTYFQGKIDESTTKVYFVFTVSLCYIALSHSGSIHLCNSIPHTVYA